MSINRVTLTGNLTRDAEARTTASGYTVISFSIAVNDRRKNGSTGEWEDYANFIDCVRFTQSEKLAGYLTKGTKVAIDGKLHWSSWEQEGQKRSKLEVTVENLEFMTGRQQGNGNNAGQVPAPAVAPSAPAQDSLYDEDIPF